MTSLVHRPVVAGYYYPAEAQALRQSLDESLRLARASTPQLPADARGVLLPHGDVRRAGRIVARTLARVRVPRCCLLLGPSHTDRSVGWSVMSSGWYRTPLGDVPIDTACAEALLSACPFLTPDLGAQRGEHAIEVLIPWLQRAGPSDLRITPIIVGSEDGELLRRFAEALSRFLRSQDEPILLIASTDLSHEEPQSRAAALDSRLLAAICAMDAEALREIVQGEGVRMCGLSAVIALLEALQRLGARQAYVAASGSSVEAGGDPHAAIGYGGVVFASSARG